MIGKHTVRAAALLVLAALLAWFFYDVTFGRINRKLDLIQRTLG